MSTMLENMKRTVEAIRSAYDKLDVDAIMALRTDDCESKLGPRSLGREWQNNTQYKEAVTGVTKMFKQFNLKIENEVYDIDARKVALQLSSDGQSIAGPYKQEYSLFLTLNEEGTKAKRFYEMQDSTYALQVMADIKEVVLKAKQGGQA